MCMLTRTHSDFTTIAPPLIVILALNVPLLRDSLPTERTGVQPHSNGSQRYTRVHGERLYWQTDRGKPAIMAISCLVVDSTLQMHAFQMNGSSTIHVHVQILLCSLVHYSPIPTTSI